MSVQVNPLVALAVAGSRYATARAAADAALDDVREALIAAHDTASEAELARRGEVDRMTVRRWLGKG